MNTTTARIMKHDDAREGGRHTADPIPARHHGSRQPAAASACLRPRRIPLPRYRFARQATAGRRRLAPLPSRDNRHGHSGFPPRADDRRRLGTAG
jgi:hypothetical protein